LDRKNKARLLAASTKVIQIAVNHEERQPTQDPHPTPLRKTKAMQTSKLKIHYMRND
jgi:hypothetical protein